LEISILTTRFESWLAKVFAIHLVVLSKERLDAAEIDLSIKFAGLLTIVAPLLAICIVGIAIVGTIVTWEELAIPIIIVSVAIFFGASRVTDKYYDSNRTVIFRKAAEIQNSLEKGRWWAAKWLLSYWLAHICFIIIFFILLI
jgi:ABC-type glycerol-3-phosphate transport system permease component